MTTIVSGFSPAYRELAEVTSKNHAKRSANVGIPYHLEEFPDGELAWPKLPAIIKHLLEGSDVFWIDIDAVFCKGPWGEKSLGCHMVKEDGCGCDINMWTDINGPCAGVMFIKNTRESLKFFSACLRNRHLYGDHPWSDQAAIRDLMLHEPYKRHVGIVDNLPLPYWEYPDLHPAVWDDIKYCPGAPLFHCPGLPLEKRIELLTPFCV